MKKFFYLFTLFVFSLSLYAYKLPDITVEKDDGKPEIVLFTAKSVLVNEKLSYILKYKTKNATKVTMTYLGDIKPNGEITLTKEEFHKGAITLSAYSDKSDYVDKLTLNGNEEVFDESNPVPKNISTDTPAFYDSIPRTYRPPYRRIRPNNYPRKYR